MLREALSFRAGWWGPLKWFGQVVILWWLSSQEWTELSLKPTAATAWDVFAPRNIWIVGQNSTSTRCMMSVPVCARTGLSTGLNRAVTCPRVLPAVLYVPQIYIHADENRPRGLVWNAGGGGGRRRGGREGSTGRELGVGQRCRGGGELAARRESGIEKQKMGKGKEIGMRGGRGLGGEQMRRGGGGWGDGE
jgi:hypothetical protein